MVFGSLLVFFSLAPSRVNVCHRLVWCHPRGVFEDRRGQTPRATQRFQNADRLLDQRGLTQKGTAGPGVKRRRCWSVETKASVFLQLEAVLVIAPRTLGRIQLFVFTAASAAPSRSGGLRFEPRLNRRSRSHLLREDLHPLQQREPMNSDKEGHFWHVNCYKRLPSKLGLFCGDKENRKLPESQETTSEAVESCVFCGCADLWNRLGECELFSHQRG